jgi:cytidyltransferase-like protein
MTCDFLHLGHIEFLKECASHCEKLIVGIMSDDYVRNKKGRKPLMDMHQRAEMVKNIKGVHNVVFQSEYNFNEAILRAKRFWENDFLIIDSDEHRRANSDIIIKGGKKRKLGLSSTLYRETSDANTDLSECTI